jgi:hypothetical protein
MKIAEVLLSAQLAGSLLPDQDMQPLTAYVNSGGSGTELSYSYASGPGAIGSPIFDANTGELLCVHHFGFPDGSSDLPAHGICTWFGGLKEMIARAR